MKDIKIKGLRSLVDTGTVEIKPINVLVGTNSSGKSTFLRTFPLIRQSIERKTRGPILWNGVYTDFDSFATSVHRNGSDDETKEIEFHFSIPFEVYLGFRRKETLNIRASISIRSVPKAQSCYTSEYKVDLDGHEIKFHLNFEGVIEKVSSSRLSWELEKKAQIKHQLVNKDSIIPIIKHPDYGYYDLSETGDNMSSRLFNQITGLVRQHSGSQSKNKINQMARQLTRTFRNDLEKIKLMKSISSTQRWRDTIEQWDREKDTDFLFFSGLIDLYALIENSYEINRIVSQQFKNVRYIAPLRASTERYYRYQDLSVDELDHRGENLGVFLINIPRKWRTNLDLWTKKHFGFKIDDKKSSSHIAINLEYGDGYGSANVADMGFGFSQILPIVVQLWSVASGYEESQKSKSSLPYIFAIEQPELHLHPRMQATLAEVFSNSITLAKENEIDLRLIIETHSNAMISKFGDLVAFDELDEKHIGVILFEQDMHARKSSLMHSNFNEDGELESWPTGFFSY
ncbi:AAA family ATPase [Vibrio mimicus]